MAEADRQARLAKIEKVLVVTFLMNLAVCVAKIVLGLSTGLFAIAADGFHSLGDSLSNIVGLFGIRLAKRGPDARQPYGWDKFEAMATLVIAALISITCWKVFESGVGRILSPTSVRIDLVTLAVMLGSMAVNVATIVYEGGAGKRLQSHLLVADSNETKSDLWVSASVIVGAVLIERTGWIWLDGALTLMIGVLILRVICEIFRETSKILADEQVVAPEEVKRVVLGVPGAEFCHAVRSRGRVEGFFLDLHLGVQSGITIDEAHDDVCHRVKLALHDAYPGLRSANIHIEPASDSTRKRGRSVFKSRDPYGYPEE